jgi:hypothetical protein
MVWIGQQHNSMPHAAFSVMDIGIRVELIVGAVILLFALSVSFATAMSHGSSSGTLESQFPDETVCKRLNSPASPIA